MAYKGCLNKKIVLISKAMRIVSSYMIKINVLVIEKHRQNMLEKGLPHLTD